MHVRSVLLQGLLVSLNQSLWEQAHVTDAESVLRWLAEQVSRYGRADSCDLCINYVQGLDWVDGIAVGMETKEQLLENIHHFSRPTFAQEEIEAMDSTRPKVGEETLNPALWRKA